MSDFQIHSRRSAALPAAVALVAGLVLISPLLPLPMPGFVSGLPWKAELFSSVFIASLLFGLYIFRRTYLASAFDLHGDKYFLGIICALAAFICWSALSSIWAASPASAAHHTLSWAAILTVTLLVSGMRGSRSFSFRVIGVAIFIIALTCIVDLLTSDFASSEGAIRIRYAKFAEMLLTVSPLMWAGAISAKNNRVRILLLSCGALGWVAVMLSLSKGAFIAGIVAYAIMFGIVALMVRKYRRRAALLAGVWLALTLTVQILFSSATNIPSTTDYISGKADATRTTSQMRLFTWKVAEQMIRDNWLIGVGADNFGLRFNESRYRYAAANPSDVDLEIGEDYLFERAHNEPLQIAAELGVVGLFLIAAPFALFAFAVFRLARRNKMTPLFISCLAGSAGFAVASMFSSFSFRAIQNGIAFAIVFGLALRQLRGERRKRLNENAFSPQRLRLVAAGAIAMSALLIFTSATAGLSRFYQYRAQGVAESARRLELINTAITFDRENAAAYSSLSSALAADGNFPGAAAAMRTAINHGIGVTQTYSVLATLETSAGNPSGAEEAMSEAVAIYPRSVFARVRYAQMLELNGKYSEVPKQLDAANAIDSKQSRGWFALLRDGDLAAFRASVDDRSIDPPASLRPSEAVYQFIDTRSMFGPDRR